MRSSAPSQPSRTFLLTDKADTDKIPLLTPGYGRAASKNGSVFLWNFPLLGTYWSASDIIIQHIGKDLGGLERLKGKKIALLFHDSPYGKEPIPALLALAQKYGFEFSSVPVPHPVSNRRRNGGAFVRTRWITCCFGAGAS